ncbi:hypothetical protein GCM10007301_26430 [Azorhizobium oxalatiphilum]|uniref:Autotransporter domain-containing protein n=1 Tax=Azorhizobium oxalatiphilum TaxID=980631 RepID=A0A917C068_9HYPH|nr:hypothetical protein GCM10007301_26430 [Azorhizobium oxalatiphilum]
MLAAGALLHAGVAQAEPVTSKSWSMYDSYTQSYFLGFSSGNALSDVLQGSSRALNLGVNLRGHALNPTVDTGSTGMAISAHYLGLDPNTFTTDSPGWVFYDSSGLLLTGYFINDTITFTLATDAHGNPVTVTSQVPVLVVTKAQCLGGGGNSGSCHLSEATTTQMIGIGFGRNTMGSGAVDVDTSNTANTAALLKAMADTPQSYNPLLNIDGTSSSTYRNGYIVTPTGIHLGLTAANTSAAYSYGQLVLGPSQTGTTWQMAQATVTVGKTSGTGALLMDTGVSDGFIGLPKGSTIVSSDGTVVTLSIEGGIATYSFTLGDTSNPQAPTKVDIYHQPDSSSFVNSSVHTYAGYNVLYDADGGFVGLSLNSYAGASTQITPMIAARGTLALTADFSTDLPVLLMADSTISTSSNAVFNGDFTGSGSLTLQGGTIYLAGTLSHSGGTVAAQGITVLTGTLIGSLSVSQGATFVDANGGYNVAAGQTLSNAGTFAAPSGVTLTNAGITVNTGTVAADFLNTGVTLNSGTFSANVTNSGTFTNNGTISGTFENTGTLNGNGTFGSMLVRSGAVVAPGNSIGVHTLTGNATFEPGSVLLAELGAPGTSDQLIVGGTLTAAGATLIPVPYTGFVPLLGATYQVITAGSIASNFTVSSPYFGALGTLYPYLAPTLDNTGLLTLSRSGVSYAALAPAPNAVAVGRGADSLPLTSPLARSMAVMNAYEAPAALMSLSGEIHATAQSTLQVQSAYVRGAVIGRLDQALSGAPGTAETHVLDAKGTTLWAQAYGGWGETRGTFNAETSPRSIGGFLIGLDGDVSGWRVGLAGGFGQSDFSVDGVPGSGGSDNYDVALYAARRFAADANGAFNLRLGAAYGWHDLSVSRSVTVPGQQALYTSGYSAGTAQVFGELGYAFALANVGVPLTLEPFAGLAWSSLSTDGFSETAGTATLIAQSASFDTLYSTLGVKAQTVIGAGTALPFTVSGTIGWQHAYGDVTPSTTFAFAAGSVPFTVTGAPLATDALLLGAGLGAKLSDTVDVSVAYSGQLASGFTESAVKGSFNWRF